jgi:hypothetical protein
VGDTICVIVPPAESVYVVNVSLYEAITKVSPAVTAPVVHPILVSVAPLKSEASQESTEAKDTDPIGAVIENFVFPDILAFPLIITSVVCPRATFNKTKYVIAKNDIFIESMNIPTDML